MSEDRRREERVPASVRVRLQYPTVETFVERYATNVSRGGIFIQSQRTQPPGTTIRFEFQISDKSPVIRGEGRVVWAVPFDPAHPDRVYGMGVRFTRLDIRSKRVIDEMVSQRLARGEADPGAAPPTPQTARLDDSVVRTKAASVTMQAPPVAAAPAAEPSPAPAAAPTAGAEPQPGDLGAPDPAPVRGPDLSFGADVRVEIGPLVERILGRRRLSADEADALLAELAPNGAASLPRPAEDRAPPRAFTPEPATADGAATPEGDAPTAASSVIADLFEESYTGPLPAPTEENEPGTLPELREVPEPPGWEGRASQNEEEEIIESELLESDVAAEVEAAAMEEDSISSEPAAPPTPESAEDAPDLTALFEEEVEEDTLSALDEPLADDVTSRPPPQVILDDVDLDAPVLDGLAGSPPAVAEAEARRTDPPAASPPSSDEPDADSKVDDDDDPKPKKGFFKKLFGKS